MYDVYCKCGHSYREHYIDTKKGVLTECAHTDLKDGGYYDCKCEKYVFSHDENGERSD
jgi:hypothetical protein